MTRAFIMKFAVQERIQHDRAMMDTSDLSEWTEECQDYSGGWYDGYSPWPQTDCSYGEFDLNAVAFGTAKGKGKSKGFQGKGYSNFGAKGQKGCQEKGKGKGQGNCKSSAFGSLLKRNAAGMTAFTGTCYECGVVGHTGKFCPQRDPNTGHNGTCTLCGMWGHEAKVCPKTGRSDDGRSANRVSVQSDGADRVRSMWT